MSDSSPAETPFPSDFQAFLIQANQELNAREDLLGQQFKLKAPKQAIYDSREGTLTLWFPDGSKVVGEAQILAFYEPKSQEWFWAWSKEQCAPEATAASRQLRDWGARGEISWLTSAALKIDDPKKIGLLNSVATKATGWDIVYPVETDGVEIFYLLRNLRGEGSGAGTS
jgi:hypothetical protein